MKDVGRLMKRMQRLQQDMARLQEELRQERVEAAAGGGVVRAVVDGHGDVVDLTIDPSVVDPADVQMLTDLIVAAVTAAQRAARERAEEKMRALGGGLP
ncbi:MAG: YbaB/EbfC family nucleoid-associated protein [Armatimonadota bacterium]|nr:YbaB/EbfC family nucleoid-associated protein [Armatimonadota bacterium]MDR7404321.1 YbaB/EbfC family nucleoid-associated protein [Armatimonadota bacterium]